MVKKHMKFFIRVTYQDKKYKTKGNGYPLPFLLTYKCCNKYAHP